MNKRKAFTLVELAIVVVVIMVLVVGVLKGASLTQTSRIVGARSFTASSVVPKTEGLVAWYETSTKDSFKGNQAYDSSQIDTWYDISPDSIVRNSSLAEGSKVNKLSRTASSAVTYVEDGINSIPTINFSGSSPITLSSLYQGSLSLSTVFVVFRPTSYLDGHITFFDSYSSGSTYSIGITSSAVTINAGALSALSGSASINLGNDYILAAVFNTTSSAIYLNDPETAITSGDAGSNSLTGLTIGSTKAGAENFPGMISEIIVFNRILKLQERRDIFRYLASKYKITVTSI
ncbi:MAG: prepilin-type N-terminal cleavage/methylation domain-containing protein [Rickettsiales bacterium]|nr:prepilin-type N-terminal cleavage/methylation domain-containing protein [Rickettsiales bacterium]